MQKSKELQQRIFYGLVMAGIAIYAIYIGGLAFYLLTFAVTLVLFKEFLGLLKHKPDADKSLWYIIMVGYVLLPVTCIIILRSTNNGFDTVLWLVLTIAASDIGGFTIGKFMGKKLLAPKISPKKTWEGLAGCCIFAGIVSYCYTQMPQFIIIGALIGLISQAGDLTESLIKRYFGVKDTSGLIPGHGGLMDRLDGYVYAAPLALLWQQSGVLMFV